MVAPGGRAPRSAPPPLLASPTHGRDGAGKALCPDELYSQETRREHALWLLMAATLTRHNNTSNNKYNGEITRAGTRTGGRGTRGVGRGAADVSELESPVPPPCWSIPRTRVLLYTFHKDQGRDGGSREHVMGTEEGLRGEGQNTLRYTERHEEDTTSAKGPEEAHPRGESTMGVKDLEWSYGCAAVSSSGSLNSEKYGIASASAAVTLLSGSSSSMRSSTDTADERGETESRISARLANSSDWKGLYSFLIATLVPVLESTAELRARTHQQISLDQECSQ
ncbi:hypothetical protein EYF80_021791 [Liparis tanakae]|uniref:Uncharacterized protein n=1 Tax=Liparis tanakae TaxID=230148 RepID=A0A4Z2HQ86_9TELE|nr:hypothetical protein EYF80_021791 [Liparis tanakae]